VTENSSASGVFQNLTIVDVSGSVATSYAAKLFADYGALVINMESAEGFPTRGLKPLLPSGESAMHGYLHTNKKSVIGYRAYLKDEPAIVNADLVIYDPNHLPRPDYLADIERNTCAISWYGLTGPYAAMQGSDATVHALSGLMRGIGTPEGAAHHPAGLSGSNYRRP
jgi:crotonobetainyl-CoA:carnitine CoA-transferase CaiB-like acyl-CoA transferase